MSVGKYEELLVERNGTFSLSDVNCERIAIDDIAVIDFPVCDQVRKSAAVATVDWMTVANAMRMINLNRTTKMCDFNKLLSVEVAHFFCEFNKSKDMICYLGVINLPLMQHSAISIFPINC